MPRQDVNIGDSGSQFISKINSNDVLALIGAGNVEDYGVVHDGITDDTAAIHTALASSNVLYFPSGIYLCNISIGNPYFSIKGDGIGRTILKAYDNAAPAVSINASSAHILAWSIRDLTIDGNNIVNGLEFNNTSPYTITEGIADHLYITRCLKALHFNSPSEGWLTYQNSFNMIKMNDNLHGIYSEYRSITYNNFSNIEIGAVRDNGYSIYEDSGIENIFYNVKTDGIIRNSGTGNRFILTVIETIFATTPPNTIAFYDSGENSNIDLVITEVDVAKCPIGYYGAGYNHIITNLKSWYSLISEPAQLFVPDAISSGVILHAQCQDATKASTYLTPAQLQNWTCLDGNFFDGLKGKVVYANTAPSTGTWAVKDICYNTEPSSGEYIGWVCTVAGTSGTWKGFGLIE